MCDLQPVHIKCWIFIQKLHGQLNLWKALRKTIYKFTNIGYCAMHFDRPLWKFSISNVKYIQLKSQTGLTVSSLDEFGWTRC